MVPFLNKTNEIQHAGACDGCPVSFLTTVLDSLKDGILAADKSGRVKMWNAGFCAIWHLAHQDLRGRYLGEISHMMAERVGPGGSDILSGLNDFFSNRDSSIEVSLKNGEIIEAQSGGPFSDPEGGRMWVFRDVTSARRKEKKWDDANRRLSDIIEFLPEPTMVVDENGIIVVWNKAIEEVSGVKKEDIIGKGNYEYAIPLYDERRPILIDWALSDEGVPIEEYNLVHQKGEVLFGEIYAPKALGGLGAYLWGVATPLRDKSGKTIGAVECMRNVTERRKTEQELHKAKLAAEAATKAKSEFLARMSHEIRTPMNSILGMCELLSETTLDYDQADYVQTLHSSGDMLLSIINDILDFSKIEAGQVALESVPFDLIDLVEGTGRILGNKAHEKGLELAYRVNPRVHRYVLGDPTRFKQILINLVSNAIKFTEKGQVTLNIHPGPDPEDREMIRIEVRDTGIGIPKDKQEQVFESFNQADTSTTRRFGGTGLGLAIVRKLAEFMGGRIWIESEPGRGTAFFVTARLKHTDEAPGTLVPCPNVVKMLSGMRVMVVDDISTNRLLLHDYLTRWGAVVGLAKDGPSAMEAIGSAHMAGTPYEMIFLDMLMPGMDGMQVAEKLRAIYPAAPPYIILNTSCDISKNRHQGAAPVLDGVLSKPLKRSDLMAMLSKIMGHPPQAGTLNNERDPGWDFNGAHLLLVEDIPANRNVINKFLGKTGIRITEAVNGESAVDIYAREGETFDIVLMDKEMPIMDGLTATREIRRMEKAQGRSPVPILALTAHAFDQNKKQCLAAGCDDFLSKPVKKKELLTVIEKFIASGEASPSADRADKIEKSSGNPDPGRSVDSTDPVTVEVDEDLKDLMVEFLEELDPAMAAMAKAVQTGDYEGLRRLAHGYKGAAGNYGLQPLYGIYLELEHAARAQDRETSRAVLGRAKQMLSRMEIKYIAM